MMMPKKHWSYWVVSFSGVGGSPKAPGTAGTLAALPFAWLLHMAGGNLAVLAAGVVASIFGFWATKRYLHATGGEDPQEVVIDEVAGVWILLSVMPLTVAGYALGFALFRLFDILKPWPVSMADQRLPGAWGVMVDDIFAGLYPVFLWTLILIGANLLGHPLAMDAYVRYLE